MPRALAALAGRTTDAPDVAAWETTNLLTVASALVDAAHRCGRRPAGRTGARTSRSATTQHWARHVDVTLDGGAPRLDLTPVLTGALA